MVRTVGFEREEHAGYQYFLRFQLSLSNLYSNFGLFCIGLTLYGEIQSFN